MLFFNHDLETRQVNWLDDRAYTNDNTQWVPSVTEILGIIDKGTNFRNWLMTNGLNANYISMKAMEEGSQVHNLIQKFCSNPEHPVICTTYNEDGKEIFSYGREVWIKFMRFVEFYTRFKPKIIAVEQAICDYDLGYGGTLDLVLEINGERHLVDNKTGNEYPEHELQLSAYAILWNKIFPGLKIYKTSILYLDAATRTEGRGDAIQGKGWKLSVQSDEEKYNNDFLYFNNAFQIWKWRNKNWKPIFITLPDHATLSEINPDWNK